MKNICLAMALTAASVNSGEAPKKLPVACQKQAEIAASVHVPVSRISSEGSGALVILGSLLLGAGLANKTYSRYEKGVPPNKRIEARVLRLLGEAKNKP